MDLVNQYPERDAHLFEVITDESRRAELLDLYHKEEKDNFRAYIRWIEEHPDQRPENDQLCFERSREIIKYINE